MNLVGISVLLCVMLAFQPTIIYGSKGLTKKHHTLLSEKENLIGNVRGAVNSDGTPNVAAVAANIGSEENNGAADLVGTSITNNSSNNNAAGGSESTCRYTKTPWTECDATTNSKSRNLTLKSGDVNSNNCLPSRTIEKKCKKNCRYEKGTWSECTAGEMSRQDKLKSTGDSTCDAVRTIKKECNPAKGSKTKKERKNKDKARRAQA